MPPNAPPMSAKAGFFVGLVFIIVGGAIVWWAGYLLLRDKESLEWPTVTGIISASEMMSFKTTETEQRNRNQTTARRREVMVYTAEISYTYTVEGKEYTSDNIEMGAETSKYMADIKAKVEAYPKGKEVTVYYNPEDHADAMLEVGFGPALYIPLAAGGFFLFMGLLGSGYTVMEMLREAREKKRPAGDEANQSEAGFTMVELLVVIAIICLLVAMIFPLVGLAREHAKRIACLSNLRNIGIGGLAYCQDFAGYLPPTPITAKWNDDLRPFYPEYITELDVFVCPSTLNYVRDREHLRWNAPHGGDCRGTSYEYFPWCNANERGYPGDPHRLRTSDRNPAVFAVLIDIDNREENHILNQTDNHGIRGGNMLFLDMHAQWIPILEGDRRTWYEWSHYTDLWRHGGDGVGPGP